MFRFVAAAFDNRSTQPDFVETLDRKIGGGQFHEWQAASLGPRLRIWSPNLPGKRNGETPNELSGLIIGRAFPRRSGCEGRALENFISADEARAFVDSQGGKLSQDIWGNYVAFIHDKRSGEVYVARDPTGVIPCYYINVEGVEVYFSDIADVQHLIGCRFSINESYLIAGILIPKMQKSITGLVEVQEVLPGEWRTLLCESGQQVFTWDPYEFVNRPVEDIEQAATMVRQATVTTVGCFASCFNEIVLSVGGLDSSIIMTYLAELAPDKTNGMTHYTSTRKGDERFYTRSLERWTNVKIREIGLSPSILTFESISKPRASVSPVGYIDVVDLAADTGHVPAIAQADCYFYGVGGDNIFMQAADAYSVLDHVQAHGLTRPLARILLDTARYSRRSLPNLLGLAFQEALCPESAAQHAIKLFAGSTPLLGVSPAVRNLPRPFDLLHPLLQPRQGVQKGKYFQVLASCFCPTEYYDPYWLDSKERVHVFLSQPLVESCLQIPSWILAYRGIDRGLARYAFKDRLPEPVLRRLSKSTPEDVYAGFVSKHWHEMRSFLLDGELCRRGVLDRCELEKIFSDERVSTTIITHSLVQLTGWEAWAQFWI